MPRGIDLEHQRIKLEKWQRVFVNRSINMGSIKAIGFDMDHTLVQYNRDAFETLAFRATLRKFIDAGYPEELNELKFDPSSVIRGLLVDRERGNLLKVDGHKYVKTAFHGKRRLEKEDRRKLYNAASFKAQNLLSVDTFFALSEVHLFTEIVDYMANNPNKIQKTFKEVYDDLRKFIDLSHSDGTIKKEVLRFPEKFVIRDKYLPQALVRMIEGDKLLFLLTNSDWAYTNIVMNYILNDAHPDLTNWRDYFEYVIVSSGKPNFFTGQSPFQKVDVNTNKTSEYSGALIPENVYAGGNAELFQNLTTYHGDEIMYVGDHIYGDIIRSKGLFNWRTMLVVQELDSELPKLERNKAKLQQINMLAVEREAVDEEIQILRSRIAAAQKQIKVAANAANSKKAKYLSKETEKFAEKLSEKENLFDELDQTIRKLIIEHEHTIHSGWGELMKVGLEKSRFAQQVEQYACLYTGRVSNLRFYSPFKRFVSTHDLLPHDL